MGLDPIFGAEFADRFGQVVARHALGQVQALADFSIGAALACQPEHLALAIGQRACLVPTAVCTNAAVAP